MNQALNLFIGVDQTGAIDRHGRPQPLHLSIIDNRAEPVQFITHLKIDSLSRNSIREVLEANLRGFRDERVLICVDSVFGLPESLNIEPYEILRRSKGFHFAGKNFGSLTAFEFFRTFLKNEIVPTRKVDDLVKASSVFNRLPFQRNIGCGTYRILKDLSQDTSWFALWPFDSLFEKQFVIAEGYPNYFWRTLFGAKNRDLLLLGQIFPQLHFENLDAADSFVLAFGAMNSSESLGQELSNPENKREGWILGVKRPPK